MEKNYNVPNYSQRKKKQVPKGKKKGYVLALLLAVSMGLSVHGAVEIVTDVVNDVIDTYHYNNDSKPYFEMVKDEFYAIKGTTNVAIDTYGLARNFKQRTFNSKDDVYHGLIQCARNFRYNLDMNFQDFLFYLNLNELSKNNPIYPSEVEVYEFLSSHNFINEDGTIDFEAWRNYDKKVFNMEIDLEAIKGGK